MSVSINKRRSKKGSHDIAYYLQKAIGKKTGVEVSSHLPHDGEINLINNIQYVVIVIMCACLVSASCVIFCACGIHSNE